MRRIHVYTSPEGKSESGLPLTEVKKRIRKFGGSGRTEHYDRDGSFQETTPITLGNNARTTYQAEYNTSKKLAPLIKTPFLLAPPIAAKYVIGTEIIIAQGQEISKKVSAV